MLLERRQYDAIGYLALPDQGGLTLEQIAEECGVTERTIYNWKNNPVFQKELKETILKYSHANLAKITDAIEKGIIEDRNAAMARLYAQIHGLIPSNEGTADNSSVTADVETMKKRISEYKKRNEEASKVV